MPSPYEHYRGLDAQEISSTGEGRHVTLSAGLINHPGAAVAAYDPVTFGTVADRFGVGVAIGDEVGANDLISMDTEGVWNLSLEAVTDGPANSAIEIGDVIFINRTTCVLSKIRNQATQIPFGYAMDTLAEGLVATRAVKVHWDPMHDLEVGMWKTIESGDYGWSFRGVLTDGESEGAAGYVQADLYGTCTGLTYGFGSWMNLQTGYDGGGFLHTPFEGGLWKGDADVTLRAVFMGQGHAILAGAPASLHAWRLNTTQTIDAIIAAANPGSVGYVADAGWTEGDKVGALPLVDVVGHGIRWVYLMDSPG